MRSNDSNVINTLEIVYHVKIALMLTSNNMTYDRVDVLPIGVHIYLWCLTDQINLVTIKLDLREIKMKVLFMCLKMYYVFSYRHSIRKENLNHIVVCI